MRRSLFRVGETGYLIQIGKMRSCDVKLWKLADSAEEAGMIITDRDCLSKGKKRKYRDLPQVGFLLSRVCEPDGYG